MNYRHLTLNLSLEGLSPRKLISDMKKEGFEPLFSSLVATCCGFLCREDPFKRYKRIVIKQKEKKPKADLVEDRDKYSEVIYSLVDRNDELPSFGELFKHKKYADLLFALIDTGGPEEKRLWLCCWTEEDKRVEEPLEFFETTVFKIIGCDKSIDQITISSTFSKTHNRIVSEELKEYKLKQASFKERKSTFEIISDLIIRDILIEFSKKDNILLSDFLEGKKTEDGDKLLRTLNFLSGQNLLRKNLVVICKKTNQWWNMTIPSRAKLKEIEKSGVTCASCGAKITKEKVDDLFKISEKGRRMVSGSYWMIGRVVESLRKLGVREEDIFVDVTYDGEEIDILALYMAVLLVFELKDREFGLGDAYKFHGKISRLAEIAERREIIPIVITTKTVAAEARRLLSEVTGFVSARRRYMPVKYKGQEYKFIERLADVESELKKLIDEKTSEAISTRLNAIQNRFPAITLKKMNLL